MPLGFSPSAMHRLAHPDGELGTSRAAAACSVPMVLSSYSTESMENVKAQGASNPYAMQLCVLRDRATTKQILERAEAAGYSAIFLSVDVPLLGRRLNEFRNDFHLPEGMEWPNLLSDGRAELMQDKNDHVQETRSYEFGKLWKHPIEKSAKLLTVLHADPSLDWDTAIPWLRSSTKLKLWLKGVLSADDVSLAIKHGLDGVVVSNHGGRQLDGVPATLDVLHECALAAGSKIPIAVDGGIRRGSDIFKAIALGASFVFVGRIPIWGLAVSPHKLRSPTP